MRNSSFLSLFMAILLSLYAIPSWSAPASDDHPKHPILGRLFIWLVRSNYKPKEITLQQSDAQARLDSNDFYKFARDSAAEAALSPVAGEIKEIRVPNWHKSKFLFFVIPLRMEYLPISFMFQPVANAQVDKQGLIVAVARNNQVFTAAYMDSQGFGDIKAADSELPKQSFAHFMRQDILQNCGQPCLEKMLGCSKCLALAPVNLHAAMSAYFVCVLNNKECGGCLLDGLAQSILDYATQARESPAPIKEDLKFEQ